MAGTMDTETSVVAPPKSDRKGILGQVERGPLSGVSLVQGSQYPLAQELYAFFAGAATMRQSV